MRGAQTTRGERHSDQIEAAAIGGRSEAWFDAPNDYVAKGTGEVEAKPEKHTHALAEHASINQVSYVLGARTPTTVLSLSKGRFGEGRQPLRGEGQGEVTDAEGHRVSAGPVGTAIRTRSASPVNCIPLILTFSHAGEGVVGEHPPPRCPAGRMTVPPDSRTGCGA